MVELVSWYECECCECGQTHTYSRSEPKDIAFAHLSKCGECQSFDAGFKKGEENAVRDNLAGSIITIANVKYRLELA